MAGFDDGSMGLRYGDTLDGARILDVGCVLGDFTAEIARRRPAAEVIGIDHHPAILAAARERHAPGVAPEYPTLSFNHADIYSLGDSPQYQGSAVLVTGVRLLHHMDDLEGALRSVRGVL